PDALIRRSISAPEISSKTSFSDLAEAYFNSMRKMQEENRLSH
ncbi:14966_t:CDS:1, partial [Funneliformis caledonium]